MKKRLAHVPFVLASALVGFALVGTGAALGDGTVYSQIEALELAERLGLGTREAATLLLNGGFPDSWVDEAGGAQPPDYLSWPVPGQRLGRGFGSRGGTHLAVDVTAPHGTPVQVMAPGVVGYADDGVRGYGNLVLVIHPGGWVTLYAHLSEFKVVAGQRLDRADVIGLVGSTGVSRGAHLHFALIQRGVPADPMKHMHDTPGQPVS